MSTKWLNLCKLSLTKWTSTTLLWIETCKVALKYKYRKLTLCTTIIHFMVSNIWHRYTMLSVPNFKSMKTSSKLLVTSSTTEFKAPSHPSQGPKLCNYEGPWFSPKIHTMSCREVTVIKLTCRHFTEAYLLEVGLTQIPADYGTLSIVGHVGIHVD